MREPGLVFVATASLLSCALQGCGKQAGKKHNGVCIFDVDRTLTCGSDLLEAGCVSGTHCYRDTVDPKTGQHDAADLYENQVSQTSMNAFEIATLVGKQDEKCQLAESSACYDRSYVWSTAWDSPKVDYALRFSKDILSVVNMCQNRGFALAIATHGGLDFTDVQNTCPDWDLNCSRPSACKTTKRCHAVQALHLDDMDPQLGVDCNAESDFVLHGHDIPKDEMVTTILGSLKKQGLTNNADGDDDHFQINFFDDEASNRKTVADQHSAYASQLGTKVITCAFSPDEWTSYQSKAEGWRGNNLAMGLSSTWLGDEPRFRTKLGWGDLTSTGCKQPEISHAVANGMVV